MKNLIYILLLIPQLTFAQISGVINTYVKVTDVDPSCNKVTVSPDPTGFSVGDTVLLIQMQGATIDESNSSSFGNISSAADYNNAGNYEFGEIAAISGNDIYLKHTLQRSYKISGNVQLIFVPQYSDVIISGTLTAKAWDGSTGGVLVFEASGIVTLNADIDVTGLGFRGGTINPGSGPATEGCNGSRTEWYGASSSFSMAGKGEGIASIILNKESGRGKQANGGGGGHGNNYGGAGGGNYASGGRGGNQSSGCNSFFYPNNYWAEPGSSLTYSNATNKVFLGGGGGAGQQNNTFNGTGGLGTDGGDGGGIVILKASTFNANSYSIIAKGQSLTTPAIGDGAGGGGGGGTVLLDISNYSSPVSVDVGGGKGDDVNDGTGRNIGPGGGGGGGILWVSNASIDANITLQASGGNAGTVNVCGCNHGAVNGSNGGSLTNLTMPRSTTVFNQTCIVLPVQIVNYFAKYTNNNKVTICWTSCNEKDNKEYIVEKSKDLHHFEPVAVIPSKGNSITNLNYTAWDYNPYPEDAYYRLSQKDIDGTMQILKVAYVSATSSDNLIKKVYPQPFSRELSIELNENALQEKAVVTIFNTIGQEVFTIETNSSELHLPLNYLPRGIYFLTVTSGGHKETVKVIKSE